MIFIQSHMFSLVSFVFAVSSYIYSVSSYFIQSSFLYSVSRTVREDIVSKVLSCSRFKNNQTELRKRQIQKYKNTENKILNSNRNIIEKTETWKNYILYSFIYFIGGIVKVHTGDIVNKSVVFKITETSCHIIDV